MVSPLNSRFSAGTSTTSTSTTVVDCPSRGNASISEDNLNRNSYINQSLQLQQHTKRTFAGIMKTSSPFNNNDSSESGYSADRDSVSAAVQHQHHNNPPFGSINYLHSNSISMARNNFKCPKRRKMNERQFAATNVKADLARAGIPFKQQNEGGETSTNTVLGNNVDIINLNKNHVQLVHSCDYVSDSLFQSSSSSSSSSNFIGRKTLSSDYTGMINAVREFHPLNAVGRRSRDININSSSKISSTEADAAQQSNKDTWSAPSTSSDVSDFDTESDSGSGTSSENDDHRNNNQVISFSPLLEDFLNDSSTKVEAAKKNKTTIRAATQTTIEPRNMLSTLSNAITMSEILQLSNTARIVTNSSAPFSIVHANAAFQRLLGKRANDAVTGTSFLSLLDTESNPFEDELSLAAFMSSSSRSTGRGNDDKKLYLLRPPKTSSDEAASQEPMKCTIRVSPILAQKTEMKEATTVGYFAIEFVSDRAENSSTKFSSLFGSNKMNAPMGVVA